MIYEIKTIGDLLKVPASRRADCMAELLNGCAAVESYSTEASRHAPRWLKWMIVPRLSKFTWIDDGGADGEIICGGRSVFKSE